MATQRLSTMRKKVADRYGKAFATKASDRLIQYLVETEAAPARRGAVAMAAEAAAPALPAVILECAVDVREEARKRVGALRKGLGRALGAAPEAEGVTDRDVAVAARQATAAALRRRITAVAQPLASFLAKDLGPAAEGLSLAGEPSRGGPEICWLNGAVRTPLFTKRLAELAADKTVERIGTARPLVREISGTTKVVGARAFRKARGFDGTGIIVAVIDSEVDVGHRAFGGRAVRKRNFTAEPWDNPDSHGTAVAGIIGSGDARFTGIAPGVAIWSYKVLATDRNRRSGDDFDGALALQQALEDGAHVANCSWGAGPAKDGSSREARACDTAWALGLVIVKSAGNSGPGDRTLTTPADAEGVIVAGATDRQGLRVERYSSRGPTADGRIRPHLVAPGGDQSGMGIQSSRPGGGFSDAGFGTSFAAPHVSGLAVLLLDEDATRTPDQVRELLVARCKAMGTKNKNVEGAGRVKI